MNSTAFLFVNENLESKYQESRSRPSIQRHVQRNHAERCRKQRNASLKSKLLKTQELLGWRERHQTDSISLVVEEDNYRQLWGQARAHDSDATEHEAYLALDSSKTPFALHDNPQAPKHASSLPRPHFGSFAFTEVNYDELVHRSIRYFTSRWKPFACKCDVDAPLCIWPGEIDSDHCPEHVLNVNDIVRNCLHNKMHMYALIATCAGRIRSVEKDIVQHMDCPEKYMAKAISLLRNFLKERPVIDEQVIIDVYFLSTFEFYLKNYSGAQIYLRIIKTMVESLGGFHCLGEYARRLCWNGDISVALEHPSPPILPQIWTPPAIATSTRTMLLEETPTLSDGTGSAFHCHKDFLSPRLLAIVAEICSSVKLLKSAGTAELTLSTQTTFEHGTALLHRLLSLGADKHARHDLQSLKEETCRYALALWVWNIFIRGAASAAVDRSYAASTDVTDARQMRPIIAKQLKQVIFRACEYANESTIDLKEYELRLWIIGVGLSGAEPGPARDWYAKLFLLFASALHIRTIEQVSNVFRGYVYLEEFECNNMKRLAELLRQASPTNDGGVVRALV